ncbi:P-loop NTPase fold protein [Providencia sp. M-8]|uniref:P-loop NTPase fold protein n=1 Tax=Providencia sp. M-8 TaxID=2713151 RepID=UPI00140D0B81
MTTDIAQLDFQSRDEFKRELVAEKVIKLLTSDIDISPMVIDGDWGTGKTEFCHKLIHKFKAAHENTRILYIDAFQADHADNPMMTVLAAVMSLLPEGIEKKTFLQKAIPVARYGLATAGKAAVGHLLKQNADAIADDLEKHLQNAADKAIDASVKALLKDHEKAEANLKALQATLANIASDAPIIIFIDELDRCRPDFSVQMLEVIKHTFNVQNVTFVLVTNLRQLKAAINHCYGSLVDAQRYLDKFLKFSFRLPEFVVQQNTHTLNQKLAAVEHLSTCVSSSSVLEKTGLAELQSGVFSFTRVLVEKNNLSLREVETLVRHIEIYHSLSDGLGGNIIFGYQLLRIFGVFISCFKLDLADSVRKGKTDANHITTPIGNYDWGKDLTEFGYGSHADVIAFMLAQDSDINSVKGNLNGDFKDSWMQTERSYFENMSYRGSNKFEVIKEVIKTLDLGSR